MFINDLFKRRPRASAMPMNSTTMAPSTTARLALPPKVVNSWVAGGCDKSRRNPDGTYGQTWMELHINGVGTGAWGFWANGCIPRGTRSNQFGVAK